MGRLLFSVGCGAMALLSAAVPQAARVSTAELLDRYLAGDFEAVVRELRAFESFGDLSGDLEHQGQGWIDQGSSADRDRRRLAAATLALEASRIGQDRAWKMTRVVPTVPPPVVTSWHAPATLLEWGCALLRQQSPPTDSERLWQLASIAVAERSQDFEFLIGYPDAADRPGFHAAPAIAHADHLQARFPDEPRFRLAIGIAEESHNQVRATEVFKQLADDIDVGGEATLRLGVLAWRRRALDEALQAFTRVEAKTRDPWVLYYARFLTGRIYEQQRREADAERQYRQALAAKPGTQSGTIALATLLFRDGRRAEAATLTETMLLASTGKPQDPWRGYADADDRFWFRLITLVRREIRQ
jgi:hypothetical protein